MISATALAFSSQQPLPSSRQAPSPLIFSSMSEPDSKPPLNPNSESPTRKFKTSPQLSRWSRARSFRSGIKPNRPTRVKPAPNPVVHRNKSSTESALSVVLTEHDSGITDGIEETNELEKGKSIYMVSDGTGWTVEHSVTAALGQFEHCLVDRVCPVNTHLFSGVDDVDRLIEIIKQAAKEEAMVVYTLADPEIAESAQKACEIWGVKSADILSPITDAISSHLGVSPSGLPRWAKGRSSTLNEDYFKRIDAIEFTIKQDDGALPQNLHKADIVLSGVSRCGKTPLSIYLAQKGYKVANVPIVMNVDLPRTLFEVDPEKVFGLTINPVVLQTIRRARAKTLGFGDDVRSSYSEMDSVKEELEFARKIFAKNPVWPVIEVTGKAIEETAATVLRMYHDRKNKCVMPRISKRY